MAYLDIDGNGAYSYQAGDNYEGIRFLTNSAVEDLKFTRYGANLIINGNLDGSHFEFSIYSYPFDAYTLDNLNNLYYGTNSATSMGTIAADYQIHYEITERIEYFDKDYDGALYRWYITIGYRNFRGEISGLDSGDFLDVEGIKYRTWTQDEDERNELIIDNNEGISPYKVTVTDYFSRDDHSYLPEDGTLYVE
jgi:hypothetical protein